MKYLFPKVALAAGTMAASQAFAAGPSCGLNNGQAATGEPINIGAIVG